MDEKIDRDRGGYRGGYSKDMTDEEIVKRYSSYMKGVVKKIVRYGVLNSYRDDLYQEGYIALIEAHRQYIHGKACFKTFAYYVIKSNILKFLSIMEYQISFTRYGYGKLKKFLRDPDRDDCQEMELIFSLASAIKIDTIDMDVIIRL